MIDNEELPIGFTMSLAQHSDILSRFASLPKQEQEEQKKTLFSRILPRKKEER